MKSCPDCNRTFEDTLTFCLVDGAILSAPFDPEATVIRRGTPATDPSPARDTSYYSPQHAGDRTASREQRGEVNKWIWLKLLAAITLSLLLSLIVAGIALAIVLNTVIFFDLLHGSRLDGPILLFTFIVFLLVLASSLALTARWWRRKRR